MKRKLGLAILFSIMISLPSAILNVEAVTNPIHDLGTVTLRTQQEATAFYNDLLAKKAPGAYQLTLIKKNIDAEQALLAASQVHQYDSVYFKPESLFGLDGEQDLYYIEQADAVMRSAADFEQFLNTYNNQNIPDIKMKLCNYKANGGYAYSQHALLSSSYAVQDKPLYGGDYLRTINRYVLDNTAAAKTYTIQNEADLKRVLTDSINAFQSRIVLVTASGMSLQTLQAQLDELTQTSPSPQFDFYSGFYAMIQQNVLTVQLYYDYPSDQCNALLAQGQSKASEIVASQVTPQMDEYTKAKVLHDYLIQNVRYDDFAYRFDLDDPRVHDFTGALFDKVAVCSGYASAYRMLLNAAGLENYYVSGSGQAYATVKKDHAWNIVKLGTNYYHVDTTWDDQDVTALQSRYLALSDAQMTLDHTWNRLLYPVCNDSSLAYFTKNHLVFETVPNLTQFVQDRLVQGQLEFYFMSEQLSTNTIKSAITQLLNRLYPDGYEFTFTNYGTIYVYHVNPKGSVLLPSTDPVIRNLHLNDLSRQNNVLLAVGDKGQILRMQSGSTGQLLPKLTDKNLLSITYGNRYFLVAGESGTLLLSADGVRFNTYKSPTKQTIRRTVFLNKKFWLMGEKGFLAYSDNAVQWTVCKTNTTYALNDLIFVSGKYFVVGQHGTLLTSTDGMRWSANNTGTSTELRSIAFGNGVYFTGGSSNMLIKSSDGKRWQQIRYETPLRFSRLAYGNGSFMAVGDSQRMLIQPNNRYTFMSGRPYLNSILISDKTCYLVGDNGQLYIGENGSIKVLNQLLKTIKPK